MTAAPQSHQALVQADAQARAALAILEDASTDPSTARVHVIAGLEALAPDEAAAERLDALRIAQTAKVADDDIDDKQQRRSLIQETRRLIAAVRRAQARDGHEPAGSQRRRLAAVVGLTAIIIVPAIVTLALTMPSFREGPWRAAYHPTKDLSGTPTVRRDGDIRYNWGGGPPLPGYPKDKFSVQWDTCMALSGPLQLAFRLTSDDGARLWVDGERVVDNWGLHGSQTRGERIDLSAGVHHLRVVYFDERQDASVTLSASLHGERPDAIPARILHYPGDTLDPNAPCHAVRTRLGL